MRDSFRNSHFFIWKNRIQNHILKECDFCLDDLPDEPYRVWFEETHMSPKEVSNVILQNNSLK